MDSNAAIHVMDGQPEPTNAELVEKFQEIIELHKKLNREYITHFIATYNATITAIIIVVRATLTAA
jgi:transcriptional regulator of met regulon